MDSKRTWKNLGEKIKWSMLSTKGPPQHWKSFVVQDVVRVSWKITTLFLAFYSGGIHCCREKSGQDGLFPFIPIISLICILTQILTWFRVISPIPHQLQVRNFMSIYRFLVALMLWEFWTFWLPALMLFLKENDSDAELKDPVL